MILNSIWLVGSYVVPLAALALFAILYFIRYRQYLFDKNGYANCQFLEDAWKGYIFANLALKKYISGSKFWWYFFGPKYIDLVNYCSERCIYELDQLDRFEVPNDNRPCFNRKAFMRHWEEIHNMLFVKGKYANSLYEFRPQYGEDPFGWMTVMIESKMFELYKKHALQLLRTKGYREFSKFLDSYYTKSQLYPHNAAFSIIASGKFHEKIMWDNSQEIGERVRHEVKLILEANKNPENKFRAEQLQLLVDTFVLKGGLAGGGYSGTYYAGLSEARHEICNFLETEKVVN